MYRVPCCFTSPSAARTLWGPCLCVSLMGWEGEERHSVAISVFKINDGTEAPQKGHRVLRAKKNIVRGAPATDHSRQGCGSESGPKSLLYAHNLEKMGKWHHPCLPGILLWGSMPAGKLVFSGMEWL